MPGRTINLAFYCSPENDAFGDIRTVAGRVARAAPDIAPRLWRPKRLHEVAAGWLLGLARPTLNIEIDRPGWPAPARGSRLRHVRSMGKIRQYRIMDEVGLPLPQWTEITPATRLDPEQWGPYVVVKPAYGRRGAFVWIHRTGRVRFKPPESFPDGHPGRRGPLIAQRFIYTGRWPEAFRIVTYLGRPVLGLRMQGTRDQPPLDGPWAFRAEGGRSIVASAKGCTVGLADDADLLELAARTHAQAFPDIPTLGVDIMRDATTGSLHLAEINASGESWMFTNKPGRAMAAEFGLDFYGQLGALDVMTAATIETARQRAR